MLEIWGEFAVNRDILSRARMNKLKVCRMKGNAINERLR